MKMLTRAFSVLLLVAAGAGGGFWFAKHESAEAGDEHEAATTEPVDVKPPVHVVTMPLKRGTITETISAYGTVSTQPGDVRVVSLPFESRVVRLLVSAGQQLSPGTEILRAAASPDALVALAEAKNAVAAAENDLKLVEQRFADRLATSTERSQAQQAVQNAKLKLASMTERGIGTDQVLKAEAAGIVSKIDVQEGQVVPAGGPLVETASGNRIEVSLGVEPDDAATLKVDQAVKLQPIGRSESKAITGKIRVISQRVDPATRLASVAVALPPDTRMMLETFVIGQIQRSVADAIVVPRSAVLPNEDGEFEIFTIKDRHAHSHVVKTGVENKESTQILSDDLKDGDAIVVQGNYELEDGGDVIVDPAPVISAATEPSPEKAP